MKTGLCTLLLYGIWNRVSAPIVSLSLSIYTIRPVNSCCMYARLWMLNTAMVMVM